MAGHSSIRCTFAVSLLSVLTVGVTSRGGPPSPNPQPPGSTADASEDDLRARPTAEDVLNALRKRRPRGKVIVPASASSPRREPGDKLLYPEGASLVSRAGRISYRDPWWVFAINADGDKGEREPPLRLLPNATLEGMTTATMGAAEPPTFVVSGELTVFEGENYLLPKLARRASEQRFRPPVQQESSESPADDLSAEEVQALLTQVQPTEEMVPLGGPKTRIRSNRNPAAGRPLMADGAPLVNRPGRLIAEGNWRTIAFESDHPEFPEPPMKLLPNQNVELMIRASEQETSGLVFVISGEVTVFRGENYLLPRAVMRRIDTGNLKK